MTVSKNSPSTNVLPSIKTEPDERRHTVQVGDGDADMVEASC